VTVNPEAGRDPRLEAAATEARSSVGGVPLLSSGRLHRHPSVGCRFALNLALSSAVVAEGYFGAAVVSFGTASGTAPAVP
jgi:hypothetical protein